MTQPGSDNATPQPWCAEARLRFLRRGDHTGHQGSASSPLKLQRAFRQSSGHCELPLLHTAGGLVGGDELRITAELEPGSRALLTSVAAQKVYGTVARSRRSPAGAWAQQTLSLRLAAGSDLEWLPQELVLYADGLFEQQARVDLEAGASFLGIEVVRLGRTAAGETLAAGRWRSRLEIRRSGRWELVDRLALGGESLTSSHGLAGEPVFGSLVWVAPRPLASGELEQLLAGCRADRLGLEGEMASWPATAAPPARRPATGSAASGAAAARCADWRLRNCRGCGPSRNSPSPCRPQQPRCPVRPEPADATTPARVERCTSRLRKRTSC